MWKLNFLKKIEAKVLSLSNTNFYASDSDTTGVTFSLRHLFCLAFSAIYSSYILYFYFNTKALCIIDHYHLGAQSLPGLHTIVDTGGLPLLTHQHVQDVA